MKHVPNLHLLFGANPNLIARKQRRLIRRYGLMSEDGIPIDDPDRLDDVMQFQSVYVSESDQVPVVFDTGASTCVSPRKEDFVQLSEPNGIEVMGMEHASKVAGVGVIRWYMRDDHG